jgi:hypothetical protein
VLHACGEVARAGAAGRLLRARRRVTLDRLIDLGSAVNKFPGGLTPIITERPTLFGYRHW